MQTEIAVAETAPIEITTAAQAKSVREWKLKIAASWKTAAESILAVAKQLVDARTALKTIDRHLWSQLQNELDQEKIISVSIQKKLLPIGEQYDKLIKHADHLPPRYNAIYELSHLTENALKKLVNSRKLSPSLEDREISALIPVSKGNGQHAASAASATAMSLARIVQTKKRLKPETKTKLIKLLGQFQKLDGIELRFSAEGEHLDAEQTK